MNEYESVILVLFICFLLFLFSSVLNKPFHMTEVYINSTRQNNNHNYKNDPIHLDDPLIMIPLILLKLQTFRIFWYYANL